jgi:hypothetical protein
VVIVNVLLMPELEPHPTHLARVSLPYLRPPAANPMP